MQLYYSHISFIKYLYSVTVIHLINQIMFSVMLLGWFLVQVLRSALRNWT